MTENTVSAPTQPASWALKAAVILGLIADAGLVVLLLVVSGFVFNGPAGADGAGAAIAGWGMTLAVCILSPLLAWPMWRRGRRDLALAMIWLPVLALLIGILIGSL
ncbi:hypothetical protein [Xanthobacter agilis]|uniref:Uncharacterized protein n=1 Tax=Xanthobacter agilis TaxID=47492 RepID=A0ABU0LB88_XANAG|nr:hypothetical protein [Xanthobacter agilis]MDQ0504371.1 hypothetical protein [Xanthobacter agilis]